MPHSEVRPDSCIRVTGRSRLAWFWPFSTGFFEFHVGPSGKIRKGTTYGLFSADIVFCVARALDGFHQFRWSFGDQLKQHVGGSMRAWTTIVFSQVGKLVKMVEVSNPQSCYIWPKWPNDHDGRIPVARQALPRVHGGFWEVYSKLREKVLSTLATEMQVWKFRVSNGD